MSLNILAVNPGHNGSAALVSDGKLISYIEEERLTREKYDGNPFMGMLHIMKEHPIDILVIGGVSIHNLGSLPWTGENAYEALVRKHYPKAKIIKASDNHHMGHVGCTFYNSGFDEAIVIVIDGSGSFSSHTMSNGQTAMGWETDTAFVCKYPDDYTLLFKRYGNESTAQYSDGVHEFDDSVPTVKAYEGVSNYLGFEYIEGGKTMGLAPYGKEDPNIPELLINSRGNKNVFRPHFPAGSIIDQFKNPYLRQKDNPKEWHRDFSKCPDVAKNLAYKMQKQSQQAVLDLIKTTIEKTGIKNVCIAGGYGLNCTANYFYRKNLPADVQLFCDPVSHDGGTSIGLAKIVWYQETKSTDKFPLDTVYLGPKYDPETYLSDVDTEKFDVVETTAKDVAKLISERNIVSIFQGCSEAGPRALGNRSILYDPTDPNGKDYVNIVKGREWFRPFAGTILKEHANEWFDMAGMEESPYMMYAIDVQSDKQHIIPSINHVDDTCRIQTVTKEQNKHYYELITEFKEISGVPILFNTSFNLAGDPLVETIKDALETLEKSEMKYLYLPEISKLLIKK